ncbi:MAG: hypothetical protein WDN04_25735 [Rhodospirillales bacterium]
MQVDRVQARGPAPKARPARATGEFGALLTSAPDAEVAGEVAPAAAVALPMSYEVASDAVHADKQARRHGRALLQALGAMQLALLGFR